VVKDLLFLDTNPALLVDGSNLLIRLLYARQAGSNLLTESELISSVADMFIHQLALQTKSFNASSCYVIFDIGGSLRKQALYSDYKANRELAPIAGTMIDTKDYIFSVYGKLRDAVVELCRAFNLPVYMESGIEADDVIGLMAEQLNSLGKHAVILSNDTDFLQMVSSPFISCYIPYKKALINNKNFPEYFDEMKGVKIHPAEYLFYKALVGDKGDNIPGISRVGYKTLHKLKEVYFTSDQTYLDLYDKDPIEFIKTVSSISSTDKFLTIIRENKDLILRNYKLIDLSSVYASPYTLHQALKFLASNTLSKPSFQEISFKYIEIFKSKPKFEFIMESLVRLTKCFPISV
jgi:5'-3' exonuclease